MEVNFYKYFKELISYKSILEVIVQQKGSCAGIGCWDCPFSERNYVIQSDGITLPCRLRLEGVLVEVPYYTYQSKDDFYPIRRELLCKKILGFIGYPCEESKPKIKKVKLWK